MKSSHGSRAFRGISVTLVALGAVACSPTPITVSWETLQSNLQASLRGLFAVDASTAWISGTGGAYAFTRDGGESWEAGVVPGADSLDFRDVEAFEGGTAYLMSAGSGERSRVYKTTDWGRSWILQHTSDIGAAFFNGMAFWDADHGMLVGDPVDGTLFVLSTADGGGQWQRLLGPEIPAVHEGEYGFAASGTNIVTFGDSGLAIASGGSAARVFRTEDRGESWEISSTPISAGAASEGIFSIAFRDQRTAMVVGGDYQIPEGTGGNIALSTNGGVDWTLAPEPHGVGFRSGVAWREDPDHPMWIAVGTSGSSYSVDGGRSWMTFDTTAFNAVAFAGGAGWAAGPEGLVARLVVR